MPEERVPFNIIEPRKSEPKPKLEGKVVSIDSLFAVHPELQNPYMSSDVYKTIYTYVKKYTIVSELGEWCEVYFGQEDTIDYFTLSLQSGGISALEEELNYGKDTISGYCLLSIDGSNCYTHVALRFKKDTRRMMPFAHCIHEGELNDSIVGWAFGHWTLACTYRYWREGGDFRVAPILDTIYHDYFPEWLISRELKHWREAEGRPDIGIYTRSAYKYVKDIFL